MNKEQDRIFAFTSARILLDEEVASVAGGLAAADTFRSDTKSECTRSCGGTPDYCGDPDA